MTVYRRVGKNKISYNGQGFAVVWVFEKLMFNKLLKMNRITNVQGLNVSPNSTKPRVSRSLRLFVNGWRKYAALPILISQILTAIFCSNIVYGCVMCLWLTVPCGIMYVNTHWWLWYPRQALFATFAVLAFVG